MRAKIALAALFAVSSMIAIVPAAPAKAGGLNCWYEYIYLYDEYGVNTGVILEVIPHCEVQQEEVEP